MSIILNGKKLRPYKSNGKSIAKVYFGQKLIWQKKPQIDENRVLIFNYSSDSGEEVPIFMTKETEDNFIAFISNTFGESSVEYFLAELGEYVKLEYGQRYKIINTSNEKFSMVTTNITTKLFETDEIVKIDRNGLEFIANDQHYYQFYQTLEDMTENPFSYALYEIQSGGE